MPILELIIELLDSFNFPNPNSTEFITSDVPDLPEKDLKPATVSDLNDCAKAYSKIEKGSGKNITPFVSYAEVENEENGRKTTAGQLTIPFYDTIRGCLTSKNTDKKS